MIVEPSILLKTRRFEVVEAAYAGPTGEEVRRQWLRHPGAVVILPLLPGDRVCLIHNFRVAVGQTLVELPAGTLDPGEDPLETAGRELIEETGYRAGKLRKIHEFFMSPGILNECMHVVLAEDLTPGPAAREPGEEIENLVVDWDEAVRMACDGRIRDAKSIAALLAYDRLSRFSTTKQAT